MYGDAGIVQVRAAGAFVSVAARRRCYDCVLIEVLLSLSNTVTCVRNIDVQYFVYVFSVLLCIGY